MKALQSQWEVLLHVHELWNKAPLSNTRYTIYIGDDDTTRTQWRSQGGARGGDRPPNRKKTHSLKKAKSVEKFWGGVHVTSSKLKLIKYVSTEENDDILEELDL